MKLRARLVNKRRSDAVNIRAFTSHHLSYCHTTWIIFPPLILRLFWKSVQKSFTCIWPRVCADIVVPEWPLPNRTLPVSRRTFSPSGFETWDRHRSHIPSQRTAGHGSEKREPTGKRWYWDDTEAAPKWRGEFANHLATISAIFLFSIRLLSSLLLLFTILTRELAHFWGGNSPFGSCLRETACVGS